MRQPAFHRHKAAVRDQRAERRVWAAPPSRSEEFAVLMTHMTRACTACHMAVPVRPTSVPCDKGSSARARSGGPRPGPAWYQARSRLICRADPGEASMSCRARRASAGGRRRRPPPMCGRPPATWVPGGDGTGSKPVHPFPRRCGEVLQRRGSWGRTPPGATLSAPAAWPAGAEDRSGFEVLVGAGRVLARPLVELLALVSGRPVHVQAQAAVQVFELP